MEYGACAQQSTQKIITASENKRKFTIKNPHRKSITKVQVDGCLKITSGKRCDYLFEINQPTTDIIYLELKGSDIEKAYQQLLATIELFKNQHKNCIKECHIVASRVPRAGTKVQQLKVQMLKSTQTKLSVHTNMANTTV